MGNSTHFTYGSKPTPITNSNQLAAEHAVSTTATYNISVEIKQLDVYI